ncbi:MAG: translation initiation factor IF-2 subunit beta [Candidatus Diapherotrites archaeon]|nr:translation initiation factor IF-2 subunit beta [Candidatus Micrarchaeota archaeon]MBU1939168.1 translation initiation factor IF-2 subunit beta [Candidatus Micrarchaeota archaeon]
MEYEKMLDRAYKNLPEKSKERVRFEMPVPDSLIQGNKTLVRNFRQIINSVHRDEKHALKFLTKESGTSATVDDGKLVLNSKFSQMQIANFFGAYMKRHVLCGECGKPDTKFIEHRGTRMMKCEACGAMSPAERL